MTDPAAPATPRRMLGQILGRHHRQQMVSGTNCSACHNYHPTSTDLINALEAPARVTPAEELDVERLAEALQQSSYGTAYHDTTGRRPTFADLTWEQRARKRQDASNIAAEYARLRSPESDR